MGDISEMRGLIVVITFLCITTALIAWIPAQFYSPPEYRNVVTPDLFEGAEVWSLAESASFRLNETGGYPVFGTMYAIPNSGLDIGDRDFTFNYRQANETPLDCYMKLNWWWFLFPQAESLEWVNRNGISRGTTLTVQEIEDDTELPENSTVSYRVISNDWNFQYLASFSYNASQHSNFTSAWNFHDLFFFWGVNFDQLNTSYNIAQLIMMILFFQLPEGMPFYINALIAVPIWTCIVYLVYVLMIKVIPFIAGG